jgi:cytidyltransferase-like protein
MASTAPRQENAAAPRPRVYADGVFDLFHSSHLEFLRKARAAGGGGAVLVIGVIADEAAGWKRPPVIPYAQRLEMIRCCRLVDEVVPDPPLVLTGEFLDEYKITHVVHGDDDLQEDFFRVPRERGVMRYVPYTREGPLAVSTSELIARIRARADLADAAHAPAGTTGGKDGE